MTEVLNFERFRQLAAAAGTQLDAGSLLDDPGFQVRSSKMHQIAELARQVAPSSAGVLITGESGTGKEVLSRWIHRHSGRPAGLFVRINCAAMAESLIESELFGHERGAFTGALDQRIGKFEAASGGTLLLDEISEIPLRIQAKLLRVLEEQELERVGGNETVRLNVRILATSNRPLQQDVEQGRFRLDLYHRLKVVHFHLPPLRDRTEEIPLLATHFFHLLRPENRQPLSGLAPDTMDQMLTHPWPGNVRQLRNAIHRACVVAPGPWIEPAHLELEFTPPGTRLPPQFCQMSLAEIEKLVILSSLQRFQGNKRAAAEHLGITARTIANKLQEYETQNRRAA